MSSTPISTPPAASATGSAPARAAGDRLPTLHQFFAPGGVLAQAHPNYEFRRGQLAMAEAVEAALRERRHLVVEAGTGTGKSLAYLLPVLRSGRRVIVSTATKNLQEQIFFKDIAFLERHLGALRVCYMKGRGNYLCRHKLYDLAANPLLNGLEEIQQYHAISAWERTTETGDRAEIAELPETSPLWPRLDARSEHCIGGRCPNFDRCFITEMRRRAAESDIIIVNHHLFFADLAVKRNAEHAPDAGILPDAAAVVFDEAHELEEVASGYFGTGVSNLRFEALASDTEKTLRRKQVLSAGLKASCDHLAEKARLFFASLPPGEGRIPFLGRARWLETRGDTYLALAGALTRLVAEMEGIRPKPEEVFNLLRRAGELRDQLTFLLEGEDKNTVFWIERRNAGGMRAGGRNVFLQATPIDVAELLQKTVFDSFESVVLTSATLAVSGGFDYIRRRLGLEHARELVVPSHFDYARQALLYVPADLPDPRSEGFAEKAATRIRRVLEATRGRAFCLFTSHAQMRDLHDRLLCQLEYPLLLQGTKPKNALIEEFRATPNAVLFATSSFWQGVDVQGEQLSCVIVDRLPFAVPGDPVVRARIRNVEAEGGNGFSDFQVPAAVISLKQGFGRLIRSMQDRGVLVILDTRIARQGYGKTFLESLPPYRRTDDLADVEAFFGLRPQNVP